MAYSLTYTQRFNKHFKNLSDEEKNQLKSKPEAIDECIKGYIIKDPEVTK